MTLSELLMFNLYRSKVGNVLCPDCGSNLYAAMNGVDEDTLNFWIECSGCPTKIVDPGLKFWDTIAEGLADVLK